MLAHIFSLKAVKKMANVVLPYHRKYKKNDGYKKSIELSHKYNLYRQNYCGCLYGRDLDV